MKTASRQSGVVNLKDVAKRAGCSIATASRVLNGHPTVGAAERERVLEAASQLRYVANSAARALRSQETRLVGLIVPTLDHAIYARMVDGLQLQLEKAGISVLINSSGYNLEREEAQARILVARGVEAVVMVGAEHRPETADCLNRASVHQVFTYTTELGNGDAAIGFDNREAAAIAGRFLLDMGHRRFGMISGICEGNDRARNRRDGFLETLAAACVPESEIVVIETSYNIELGGAAMRSLMQTRPRPTAVFCGSDILAVGAVRTCRNEGISIPEEVSVVGFDDLEIAQVVTPELTTLNVPVKSMGEAAADATLALFQGGKGIVTHVPLRLVVRQSTGPPPEA